MVQPTRRLHQTLAVIFSALLLSGCGLDGSGGSGGSSCVLDSFGTVTTGKELDLLGPNAYSRLAMKVVLSGTGTADAKNVSLTLQGVGSFSLNTVYTLTASIQADTAGNPSGTPLASGSIFAYQVLPQASSYTFTFSSPVTLTKGTTYWIHLEANYPADGVNYIEWLGYDGGSGGGYANGSAKYYKAGTWDTLSIGGLRTLLFALGC